MITAIVGFLYWLGNQGQLSLWHCNPKVAFVMVCVFIVEAGIEILAFGGGGSYGDW